MSITYFLPELMIAPCRGNIVKIGRLGNSVQYVVIFVSLQSISAFGLCLWFVCVC